jgi:hypothetical protein
MWKKSVVGVEKQDINLCNVNSRTSLKSKWAINKKEQSHAQAKIGGGASDSRTLNKPNTNLEISEEQQKKT